jgi:hypothetical protein
MLQNAQSCEDPEEKIYVENCEAGCEAIRIEFTAFEFFK